MSAHPIPDCSLMAFFSNIWTSVGSALLAMTSLGVLSGSVDSCQRMDVSMLVMVSGVMLLMVDLIILQCSWVVVESCEQYRTCSIVSTG
jgi:hypothetical protein